jgi:cytoplasmic polyadenylation element-binding protein
MSIADKGAQFQLPDNSFNEFKLFRKRSATFPSVSTNTSESNQFDFSDTSSEGSTNAFHWDGIHHSPHLSQTPNSPTSPHTPHSSHSSHFKLSDTSPMLSNVTSPLYSSVTSPMLTPLALYNGLHLPVRPLMSYNNLYPVYSNTFIERNNWQNTNYFTNKDRIEEMAKSHRNAASQADARYTWSGNLPTNQVHKNPVYSCKVFLGGVPWEMSDHDIKLTFSRFGAINVHRPGKDVRLSRSSQDKDKAGYLYLIFESDKQVKSLLNACTHDFSNGGKYYYSLHNHRYRPKEIQVIPWNVYDSTYVKSQSSRVDANKTVFVGALHGMLTAEGLALILEDLFGGVVYVGIDTDKFKYPIGSGRVTFSTTKAYTKAVQAGFIDVKATRFQKKVRIEKNDLFIYFDLYLSLYFRFKLIPSSKKAIAVIAGSIRDQFFAETLVCDTFVESAGT